jgi:hypothetical protein
MRRRFPTGLIIPPVLGAMIAAGTVRHQSARHEKIANDLRSAKQEVSRLEKLLPKGETAPSHGADECKDEHHAHGR